MTKSMIVQTLLRMLFLTTFFPGDIYLKARELHFNSEVSRVCLLIKIVSKTDVSAYDIIQNLFPDKSKDFVININEVEIALVKEIKPDTESRDLGKACKLDFRHTFERVLHTLCCRHRHNGYRHQGSCKKL